MADPATIATIKTVGSVVSTLGAVNSLMKKTPSAPKVEAATPMPTEDSTAVAEAKRRALIAQTTRGGRASTVLTDTETFGGN